MKRFLFFILIFLSFNTWSQVDADLSGNIEAQARHSWNNPMAKDDLGQDWDEEDFYLLYGNLNGKIEFKNSRIESNIFGRYSQSQLYNNSNSSTVIPNLAPQIFTYPNKLVAREVFNLTYNEQSDSSRTEAVINKLFYEWDYEEHRVMAGRIYINYGQGEIFNPINPFNQPTGLTSISQVAQGNDGFNATFYVNDNHTIDFYLLGDKRINGYDGQIQRTLWAHGEYQATSNLQLDYVIGEDQNRDKVGGEIRYNFTEAMVFVQSLFQTDYIDDTESHPLFDALIGYDQQLTSKSHLRVESGYQKKNQFSGLDSINNRFLPVEYFVAVAGQYEIHPLIKLGATVIDDIKTGFSYLISRNTFDLGHSTELDIFAYVPLVKGTDIEIPAQKLVTTDIGIALRSFF